MGNGIKSRLPITYSQFAKGNRYTQKDDLLLKIFAGYLAPKETI
jgi:hypothetical protein